MNDYTTSKYKMLKEELESDFGISEFDKKQYYVPSIKKVELQIPAQQIAPKALQKLQKKIQSKEQYRTLGKDSPRRNTQVLRHSSRRFGSKRAPTESSESKKPEMLGDYSKKASSNQQNQGETESGDTSEKIRMKNFLVVYPKMTETEHQKVLNIRYDVGKNYVPAFKYTEGGKRKSEQVSNAPVEAPSEHSEHFVVPPEPVIDKSKSS